MPTTEFDICLPIADRRIAMRFYTDVFGFDAIGEPAGDGVPEPLRFAIDERTRLMLIPADGFGWVLGDLTVATPGTSECVLSISLDSVTDVDRIAMSASRAGGSVLTVPRHEDWGYTALCADPDGHAWQLIAAPSL